ncbi:MAG: tRNA pseudouridine(38-40) synthase TruA [Micromonosporaceae bacterium]
MVRVRLDVAYDGTDFSGWAVQPGQRTVAGVLAAALTTLFGTPSGLTVAGRTDAGVHATGQVCHVDVPALAWAEPEDQVVRRLAGLLPPDVRVSAVTAVPDEFDARFAALRRRYAYRVGDAPWGVTPLRRRDTLPWPWSLDPEPMNAAAQQMVGQHDFAAYCRRKEHGTTIRTVQRLDWRRDPDGTLVATVEADAFCQAMVRSLVGALLPVGDGRRPVDWPGSLLARRERANEVVVAPAYGLTLIGVDYPPPERYASRTAQARNRRDS